MSDDGTAGSSQTLKPWANHPLLARPLYAFDLPSDLTAHLELRSIDVAAKESDDAEPNLQSSSGGAKATESSPRQASRHAESSVCLICPGAPESKGPAQVRAHLRSDWHRYNAALSRRGEAEQTLLEDKFHKLVDELSSDEESSDEESAQKDAAGPSKRSDKAPQDPVATLLQRMRKMSVANESDITDEDEAGERDTNTIAHGVAREPQLWFRTKVGSDYVLPQTQLGVLRFLFPEAEGSVVPRGWYANCLQKLQPGQLSESATRGAKRLRGAAAASEAARTLGAIFIDASGEEATIDEEGSSGEEDVAIEKSDDEGTSSSAITSNGLSTPLPMRTWTIILLGGGDFAAITIALNPYEHITSKRKGISERQFLVLARKQFHRYTTRRKQGGSQSAQDASGRFAKSAGAQLRRYGEQQLGDDIRETLDSAKWRTVIQKSDRVWVRAGLRGARGVLWTWPGSDRESPLDEMRRQDKVYSLPIATRKPNIGECLRCFAELTRVRVRHETEEEMQQRDAMYKAQLEGAMKARQERQEQRRKRVAERKQREAAAATAVSKAKAAKARAKIDPAEQLRRERLVRLINMIRRGRMQNVVNHLEKYELELFGTADEREAGDPDDADDAAAAAHRRINAPLPDWWRVMDAKQRGVAIKADVEVDAQVSYLTIRQQLIPSTLLQVAAEGGHENVVNYFLLERRADPAASVSAPPAHDAGIDLENGEDAKFKEVAGKISAQFPHRTAYDLCSTREARDVFRRLMAAQPDWAAWSSMVQGGARVPKALTEEMEEARSKEEGVRDRRAMMRERARQRQRDAETAQAHTITDEDRQSAAAKGNQAVDAATASSASHASSNRLGGSAPRALQKQRDEAAGLTPEMRQRIEREKRARAAEARFKALQPQ